MNKTIVAAVALAAVSLIAACGGEASGPVPPPSPHCTYSSAESGTDVSACPHPERVAFVAACDAPTPESELTPSDTCQYVQAGAVWCCEHPAP